MGNDPPLFTADTPVADKYVATTFDGSDGETVENTATEATGGRIQLSDIVQGTTASVPDQTGSFGTISGGQGAGLEISPNKDLTGVRVYVGPNGDTPDELRLEDSGGSTITTEGTVSLDSWHTLVGSLTSGSTYRVKGYKSSDWNVGDNDSNDFPYSSADIDITDGRRQGVGANNCYVFEDVQALAEASSGSATVEWSQPADVFAWDTVTYQTTADDETVTVDVQEDDGGWTTVSSGVSRGDAISTPTDPSNNVRLKFNLSRSDTANNPTVDFAAIRWKY